MLTKLFLHNLERIVETRKGNQSLRISDVTFFFFKLQLVSVVGIASNWFDLYFLSRVLFDFFKFDVKFFNLRYVKNLLIKIQK